MEVPRLHPRGCVVNPELTEARRRIRDLIWSWDRAGRVSDANALERALDIIDAVDREAREDGDQELVA